MEEIEVKKELLKILEGNEVVDYDEEWKFLEEYTSEEMRVKYGIVCVARSNSTKIVEEYLNVVNRSVNMGFLQKYYVLNQVQAFVFGNSNFVLTDTYKRTVYQMYDDIYRDYLKDFSDIEWIDADERDDSIVFVTTQQFLGLNHGPTKTTLDRARVLKQKLGKEVIIINTAEMGGGEKVHLAMSFSVNYDSQLADLEEIIYEGEKFPYVQFPTEASYKKAGEILLGFVKEYKPTYIVNIGGGNLMLDICSEAVPVLNVNTVPSNITYTHATAQVVGNISEEKPETLLKIIGKTKDSIIQGRFTSSLKPQSEKLGRKQLGYKEDCFAIGVVGYRLTTELDERFMTMIEPILEKNVCLLIIGQMDNYEQVCNNNDLFRKKTVYLHEQNDVLAILDNVDLYVNPDRTGGGTSVIEAMYKGVPVVTLNHGDVALGAGEEFCVSTYTEMAEKIIRYMEDTDYYKIMSMKAKERAEYMLDSDSAFVDIIREFETRFCDR